MDTLNLEALQSLAQSDPASLDLALLAPLQQQLSALGDDEDAIPPEALDTYRTLKSAVDTLMGEQITRLNKLADTLTQDWQKAVKAKRPIEDRWLDDERRFMGKPKIRETKQFPNDAADAGRINNEPINVHATRSRVLMCWGRLCDMMLPANDFPVRVSASDEPDPQEFPSLPQVIQRAVQQAQQAQQPPPDPKAILATIAEEAAAKMQQRVFQMLRDANFQAEGRKALFDCARIGTGLLKGPFPTLKYRRTFQQGGAFEIKETPKAGIGWVDPWKFFYDMTPTLGRSSATHEVQILSRREMEDFKRFPRTLTTVIDELLEDEEPKLKGEFRTSVLRRNEYTDMREPLDDVYAVLETHKVISKETLRDVMGIEWDHPDLPLIHLWSCDGKCIKFKLTPLERDFRVDYYNLTIMPADDTIFGYGYSYMASSAQRFTDGAVQATLANAAASVAPMLLVAQGKVQPNRENWKAQGLNIWSVENGDQPIENFMSAVQVPSNVEQNLELLKVAQDMMDQDTLFAQILQGTANGEEMPASGMVLQTNIAGVFQKSIAAYADDNCFQPLAERLIWWQKMYGLDDPIEGDCQAKAIAATQLVAKDLALQHTQVAMQVSGLPQNAGYSDSYALYKSFMANIDGLPNRDEIVHDRETAMANQAALQKMQQQGDPNQAAKLASDERIAIARLQSQERIAQGDQQVHLLQAQTQLKVAEMTLQARLVELQTQKDVDITAVSADIQKASMDDQTKRFQTVLEKTIEARLETAKLNATPSPYSARD